jgi:tetratricopeptide (TPR) repeat protein
MCLETGHTIAFWYRDPHSALTIVRKAREITGFGAMGPRAHAWDEKEAWAYLWMGHLSRALDLLLQAEEKLISVGMQGSDEHMEVLDSRADVLWVKSEYPEAHQLFAQIIEKTSPTCSPRYHANALCRMAELDILMGREETGIVFNINAAKAVYMALGSRRALFCSWLAAELMLSRGETEDARAAFLECFSNSRSLYPDIPRFCLAALADPVHKMHGTMDTFRWAVVYFAFVKKAKNSVDTLQALRRLADLHVSLGEDETALHLFYTVLEGGTKMDIHRLRAECMVGIGDIMLRRSDPIQAKEMWVASLPLFYRSSRLRDIGSVEKRLEKMFHTAQANSHGLRMPRAEAVHESTDSASVVLKLSDSDPGTVESSSFESLSAPTKSLPWKSNLH